MPLAETGSKLYFVISGLDVINVMYKFSLNSYLKIFQNALEKADTSIKDKVWSGPSLVTQTGSRSINANNFERTTKKPKIVLHP